MLPPNANYVLLLVGVLTSHSILAADDEEPQEVNIRSPQSLKELGASPVVLHHEDDLYMDVPAEFQEKWMELVKKMEKMDKHQIPQVDVTGIKDRLGLFLSKKGVNVMKSEDEGRHTSMEAELLIHGSPLRFFHDNMDEIPVEVDEGGPSIMSSDDKDAQYKNDMGPPNFYQPFHFQSKYIKDMNHKQHKNENVKNKF